MKAYTTIARSVDLQLFSAFLDDRPKEKQGNGNIDNWQSRVQCFQLAGHLARHIKLLRKYFASL